MRRLVLAFLLLLPTPALTQDYPPQVATVYGTADNDYMTVDCDRPRNGEMRCSFVQVMVSRVGKPEEFEDSLPAKIAQLLEEQQKEKEFSEMCQGMAMMAEGVKAGTPPKGVDPVEFSEGMKNMPEAQKEDILATFDRLAAFCDNPNEHTAENFIRGTHERELRSCKVSTNRYVQTFRTSDAGKTWIANEGPTGECGLVVISKLEKSKDFATFWTYHTRKIVTNKDAKQLGIFECTGFDEREFFYDWKGDEKFLRCDYIKFGF